MKARFPMLENAREGKNMGFSFQMLASLVGFAGGLLGIVSIIMQFRDRIQHPKLTICQREETLEVQKNEINFDYPALVPAISANLVNMGTLRLYPKTDCIYINGQLIFKVKRHDLEEKPFTELIEYNQATTFAYFGNEICECIPVNLRSREKLKVWVVVTFKNGKTCRSNKLTVSQASLKIDLPVLEFGM
jgi:hypothetical protein